MGKFKIRNLFLGLISIFILMSCSSDVEEKKLFNSNLSFANGEVKGVAMAEAASSHKYAQSWPDLYKARKFVFTTCLTDVATIQPLLGESFEVNGTETKSDVNGCVKWEDNFEYTNIYYKGYIQKQYILEGRGHYNGELQINLLIDPWNGNVIETRNSSNYVRAKNIEKTEKLLSIDGPRINYKVLEQDKNKIKTEIEFSLKRKSFESDGSFYYHPLTKGEFEITINFIEFDTDENIYKLIESITTREHIEKNRITMKELNSRLVASPKFNNKNYIQILAKPINAPTQVNAINGHIVVDSFLNSSDYQFSYGVISIDQDHFRAVRANQASSSQTDNVSSFKIDKISFENGVVESSQGNDDGSTHKNIPTDICLLNSFDQNATIKGTSFDLYLVPHTDDQELDFLTNPEVTNTQEVLRELNQLVEQNNASLYKNPRLLNNGCINEILQVKFDEYVTSNWVNYHLVLIGTAAPFKNEYQSKLICINPNIDSSDFAMDQSERCLSKKINTKESKLKVDELTYKYISTQNYKINKEMHLDMEQTYELSIDPYISVFDLAKNQYVSKQLFENEIFNIELLFHTPNTKDIDFNNPNLSNFSPFAYSSFNGSIQNGKLKAKFNLPVNFALLPFLLEKSLISMKVTPVNLTLKPLVITTFFQGELPTRKSNINHTDKLTNVVNIEKFDRNRQIFNRVTTHIKNNSDRDDFDYLSLYRESLFSKVKTLDENSQVLLHNLDQFNLRKRIYANMANEDRRRNHKINAEQLSQNELNALVDLSANVENIDQSILKKLCSTVYGPIRYNKFHNRIAIRSSSLNTQACEKDPAKYLKLTPQRFVNKIYPETINVTPSDAKSATGYSYMIAESKTTGHDIGRHSGYMGKAALGIDLSKVVGVSLGGGAYYETFDRTYDSTAIQEFTRDYVNQENLNLVYQRLETKTLADTKKCVLVEKRPLFIPARRGGNRHTGYKEIPAKLFKVDEGVLHLCDEKTQEKEEITESYYIVIQKAQTAAAGIINIDHDTFKSFTRVIRGERKFEKFWESIKTEQKYYVLKMNEQDYKGQFEHFMLLDNLQRPYQNVLDGSYRGLVMPQGIKTN